MFDKLKRFRSVFFILFIFICSVSAQITENSPETKPNKKSLSDFEKKDFSVKKKFEDNSAKKFLFQQTPADKTDQDTVALDDYRLRRGEKELNIEIGYSPFQPTFLSGDKEYDTSGRSFGLVSLRWGRVIGTAKRVTYEYQIEVTPIALALTKRLLNNSMQVTMEEALDDEGMAQTVNFGTKDTPEAIMAFVEKRGPRFHGR